MKQTVLWVLASAMLVGCPGESAPGTSGTDGTGAGTDAADAQVPPDDTDATEGTDASPADVEEPSDAATEDTTEGTDEDATGATDEEDATEATDEEDAATEDPDVTEATDGGCVPDCGGKECGDDGCGGDCGPCPAAAPVCTDDFTCACVPDCEGKSCGDDGCGGSCGACAPCNGGDGCFEGTCACCPSCEGKECGGDGCGGSCGTCPAAAPVCTDDFTCACVPDCEGKSCGDDGCGGSCGACAPCNGGDGCSEGTCACCPSCEGKECGGDGCGGSCGTCPAAAPICGDDGLCAPTCTPSCAGKECGGDGCGGSCGACPAAAPICGADFKCEPETCTPDCAGKICGDDGCGGSCGDCGEPCDGKDLCNDGGGCACCPDCEGKSCGDDSCGGTCGECADSELCSDGGQCVPACSPDCEEKECGDDGCGGSCGECPAIAPICGPDFKCQLACIPNCADKECGDDGCGSSCGACPADLACADGACVPLSCTEAPTCDCVIDECLPTVPIGPGLVCSILEPEPDCLNLVLAAYLEGGCGGECNGITVPGLDALCNAPECAPLLGTIGALIGDACNECACEPECTGKTCGDDGCGGSCGACAEGTECKAGACVEPSCGDEPTCLCIVEECFGALPGGPGLICPLIEAEPTCFALIAEAYAVGGCGPECGGATIPGIELVCNAPECAGLQPLIGLLAGDICDECACVPQCADKECGGDGCGGACGECGPGETCAGSSCVPAPETCSESVFCITDCPPGVAACSSACTVELPPDEVATLGAYAGCIQTACGAVAPNDVPLCVFTECYEPYYTCLIVTSGDIDCNSVADCSAACTDSPCVFGCLADGTKDASQAFLQGQGCLQKACGANPSPACTVAAEEGVCASYFAACEGTVASGACTNASDLASLAAADALATMSNCGLTNLGNLPAVATCFADETGVSEECAGCFGDGFGCIVENCLTACGPPPIGGGPESDACAECRATFCNASFEECSGIPAP